MLKNASFMTTRAFLAFGGDLFLAIFKFEHHFYHLQVPLPDFKGQLGPSSACKKKILQKLKKV
jgi:hypothetical protein